MKSFRLLFPIVLLAATFLLAGFASAASKPAPPPDLRKLVQSVDAKNNSLVIRNNRDKSEHSYTLDDRTVLTINGSDGMKIADVKPGMVVEDYVERYSDTLDSLTLSGYGTEPAKPKKPVPPKPKPVAKPATNAVQTPASLQN